MGLLNTYNNLDCDIMAFILFLIIFSVQTMFYKIKDDIDVRFSIIVLCGAIISLLEIIKNVLLMDNHTQIKQMATGFVTGSYDVVALFMACVFADYVYYLIGKNCKPLRFFEMMDVSLFFILLIILIINIKTGIMYSFNSDGELIEGPLILIEYIFPAIVFFTAGIYLFKSRRKFRIENFLSNMSYLFFPLLAICIELFSYKYFTHPILLAPLGCAFGALTVFLSIESPDFEALIKAKKDLQESKLAESLATQEANNAAMAKTRFLANMTHEIRTPINAIMGLNDVILQETREKGIFDYALKIRSASNNLLSIVNDVLDYSKLEAGKMTLSEADYNMSELLLGIYMAFISDIKDKNLQLILKIDEDIPRYYTGDDIRIKQILTHLVDNSIKFTEEGNITITIQGIPEEGKEHLFFTITDTGCGIDKADMEKIYNPFYASNEEVKYANEGSGLGLNIVEKLLNMMDSHLNIDSTLGEGTSFKFDIYQTILDDEQIGDMVEYINVREQFLDGKDSFTAPEARILVVDDTELNLFVIEKMLRGSEVQVTLANSGKECLEITKDAEFDLILMDHMMPEMDGIATRKKLLENPKTAGIPVIALTASSAEDSKRMFLSSGFVDFVEKPINQETLEAVIKKHIPADKIIG